MKKAFAISENDTTVYKIGEEIFSKISDIFNDDEDTRYLTLSPVDKYNLIMNIYSDAENIYNSDLLSVHLINDALNEYLESIGDDALYIFYSSDDLIYIRNKSIFEIKENVLNIIESKIDE